MASTFGGLEIARSGMMTYNVMIQTTAHNVANIQTEGYSRQKTNITSVVGNRGSFAVQGYGVQAVSITRQRSEYYDTKYQNTQSTYNQFMTESYYLNCLQDAICGDVTADNKSRILDAFDDFYAVMSNLRGNANNTTIRTQAVTVAQTFTDFVNNMAVKMQQLQDEANADVKVCVEQINSCAERIVSLNKQINTIEAYGTIANDLRDQRSLLVDELSQYCNVEVLEKEPADGVGDPQYFVYMNGGILVDTYHTNLLEVEQKKTYSNINDIAGCYEIKWADGTDFKEHNSKLGGRLQALFEMRDGNNATVLEGTIDGTSGLSWDSATEKAVLTLTDTNCNDVQVLNIPAHDGEIIVNGRIYTYESFEVEVAADGKFTYKFNLDTTTDITQDIVLKYAQDSELTIRVGEPVDAKGIPYYMAQLNEFVRTFAKEFNAVQNGGLDLNDEPGIDFFNATVPATGENYVMQEYNADGYDPSFHSVDPDRTSGEPAGSYYYMTALNICVTREMMADPGKIAGKLPDPDGGSVGSDEGGNIQRLTDLKDNASMFVHGAPDAFIQYMTSTLGVNAKRAQSMEQSQSHLLYAIDTNRQSVSGVDEDEEGADMIIFQNMLIAQYRVLSVLNEVLDKLINETAV